MKGISLTLASLALAGLLGAACSVNQTEAPALTGPSEFALSVSVSASPDSISQDGRSTSTIAVVARDPGGRPQANVPFRLDMTVDGEAADYGTLSNKTVVTGSDGRATTVYTAPAAPPNGSTLPTCDGLAGRCVQILATAVGSDFNGAAPHSVRIHLVPTGVITPASTIPVARFTFAPTAPAANTPVLFNGTTSCGGSLDSAGNCPATAGRIVSWAWSFSDGATATGATTSHAFSNALTYQVTLTVTNDAGLAASTTQTIQLGAGAAPTAVFNVSPSAAVPGQPVQFDATASRPGAGHSIVRLVWNFGDGSAPVETNIWTASHTYTTPGSYVVTLNVADEAGQVATSTQTVSVGAPSAPTASFVSSPTAPAPGQQVNVDASVSKAGTGHTLVKYAWNWGDGSAPTTSSSPIASHTYAADGTYVITLTVTDEAGVAGTTTQSVKVATPTP